MEPAQSALELQRQVGVASEKYTYFLLTASGAAIAYAVEKSAGLRLSPWLWPLGGAVASWSLSFLFGCLTLSSVVGALRKNYELLQVDSDMHLRQPVLDESRTTLVDTLNREYIAFAARARVYAMLQFLMFIVGILAFVGWRVADLYRATYVP